jgi:hypothetical protein
LGCAEGPLSDWGSDGSRCGGMRLGFRDEVYQSEWNLKTEQLGDQEAGLWRCRRRSQVTYVAWGKVWESEHDRGWCLKAVRVCWDGSHARQALPIRTSLGDPRR